MKLPADASFTLWAGTGELSLGINSAEKFWQPIPKHTEKYFDLVININDP